jgi:hypothetical protein
VKNLLFVPRLAPLAAAVGVFLLVAQLGVATSRAQTSPSAALPTAPATEPAVVLRGLDKVTARITTFSIEANSDATFGTLRIIARACRKRPPEEPPEVAAFLEIEESRPDEAIPRLLFSGWMFASSPALSALEHPVYDVWVIDCKTSETDSSAPPKVKSGN